MMEELTVRKAVEFAVQTEALGNFFYERLADRFKHDDAIREVFSTLAKDEAEHEKLFRTLLETVEKDRLESRRESDHWSYLKVLSRTEFFMGESGLYRDLEKIKTREDALERALRLEKDAMAYYLAMKDVLGKSEILDKIIAIEKEHVAKLIEYMITGAKMRGLGDTSHEIQGMAAHSR
jgi:rubrerythrin